MLTNEVRRELLDRAKASGYPGSITEVFQAADQGIDLIEQHQMQQQEQEMMVAQTPQEQEVGLREQHAMGNTQASMAFPDVQPNQSFNTVGMKAPIDIQKIDNQGHLVESYKNVPPGIQDLPTGPSEGTIIESPAAYQTGGFQRREDLKNAIDIIVNKEPEKNREKLRKLLEVTNFMENSMGYNPKAYGRDYTSSQASIDPIMVNDLFDQRVDEKGKKVGYSKKQKAYFKYFKELGLPTNKKQFNKLLKTDNALAAVAAMRMTYGRVPDAIPNVTDTADMFKYYNDNYRRNLKIKDTTKSEERFIEGYKMNFRKGGLKDTIKELQEKAESIKEVYDNVTNPRIINTKNLRLDAKIDPMKQSLAFDTKFTPTKRTTITGGVTYIPGSSPQYTAGLKYMLKHGGLKKCRYGC